MKNILLTLCLVFALGSVSAQEKSYSKLLGDLTSMPELKNAGLGIYAENLTTGEVIFNHNSELSLVPASVFKILPTSIALELFGTDYKFKTEIAYSGNIEIDGTLKGDLYIIGYGDPALGSSNFTSTYNANGDMIVNWVNKIKEAGITKIDGNIIADASYFNKINIPDTWIWEDLANYYGNQGSSLCYMDNLYFVHFKTGNTDGSPTTITKIEPDDLNLEFKNEVLSSSTTWDESFIFFGDTKNQREIRGTLPWKKADFSIKGSMPEPELYLANVFRKQLSVSGIEINGNTSSIFKFDKEIERKIIYTEYSPTLLEIATVTNLKSFNLYAEMLSFHISKKQNKTYADAVKNHLSSKSIEIDGLNIEDACGLSHFNSLTAKQMTQWLKYMRQNSAVGDSFYSTLPVAGTSGTLSRYCIGTKAQNRLHAKSGSMTRVRAYGGYILNAKGEEIVFCFIANNYSCNNWGMRRIFEDFFNKIAETE
ncbi:MAG: D-alanyl-D-alanine carboxypeptidase/D-alanyl-D-alanine-endopeptidase [Bacteroidales bacterium]|nr:D-alanyl-D-alanine carboxypeptidase/D-alanyl-D-alanine-endopeptidase [Bacteroidales bacterium]